MEKVYVVFISWQDGDSCREQVLCVCQDADTAKAVAEEFNGEHFITPRDLYSIVPEEIFVEWHDIHARYPQLEIKSYRGYSPEDFDRQERRVEIYDQKWNRAYVQDFPIQY